MPRITLGKLRAGVLVFLILGSGTVAYLWHRGTAQAWIQHQIVKTYLNKVQPHLPFQIEKIEFERSLTDLFAGLRSGQISGLGLVLRWERWRVRLNGPIRISAVKGADEIAIEYAPRATIEPVKTKLAPGDRSSPFDLKLALQVATSFEWFKELRLTLLARSFEWPLAHLTIKDGGIVADWRENQALTTLHGGSIQWNGSDQHAVNVSDLQLVVHSPFDFQPFRIGPEATLDWTGKSAEVLWDDTYLDLPLSSLPGRVEAKLRDNLPAELNARIGPRKKQLSFHAHLEQGLERPIRVEWDSEALPIKGLFEGILASTSSSGGLFKGLAALKEVELYKGTIETEGRAEIRLSPFAFEPGRARVRLKDFGMNALRNGLLVRGVELDLPFSPGHETQATFSVRRFEFKHFYSSIEATRIRVIPRKGAGPLPESISLTTEKDFPLKLTGIPVQIGPAKADFGLGRDFHIETSLKLPPTEVSKILGSVCLQHRLTPPATVEVDFPKLEFSTGTIDPTGDVKVHVFDGTLQVGEMLFTDLNTEVPELDFDLDFGGIQLEKFGEWFHFGEMDGILVGYAHDVTFQSWLPTHYDSRIEVKPHRKFKVVFSPDAMKNFVRLVIGDDIEQIPAWAGWWVFGLPSRILFGYDVHYAGITAHSEESHIIVGTLDPPPPPPKEGEPEEPQKHFILKGLRFNMPLNTPRYPLVLDNTALGNFARRVFLVLSGLSKGEETENESQCIPENMD